ncbi:hypothetical protein ACFQ9X_01735 [Catenulispora yoronensis]
METSEILAAAAGLLGSELTDPVDLGGGPRSVVLRVRTAEGGTVVLKAHEERGEFLAESAGLRFTDLGPRLLAADEARLLIAMEDLGAAPSLADVLLGGDEKAAREALVAWAGCYGRLAAWSVGREPELSHGMAPWLERRVGGSPRSWRSWASRSRTSARSSRWSTTASGFSRPATSARTTIC